MRFAFLCSILAASSTVASVCKPQLSRDSSECFCGVLYRSTGLIEALGTVTAHIETTTTTASVDLPTSIATTTTDALTTGATSVHTETETGTSTATASDIPIETFSLSAQVPGTVSQELSAAARDGGPVYWPTPRFIASGALSLSIEPTTNYLREANGFYLCVEYGDGTSPNGVKLCALDSLNSPSFGVLTCEIATGPKIACSAPAGQCIGDDAETKICSRLLGTFDQFYYYRGPFNGIYLGMASAENPPNDSQTAVELQVRSSET
ncbi:hypothetical protein F53441_7031 [Fusarium austroafricanum]|uniref:Ubiquitin 3 binding protein But2 C-terminal domain-containing protein n=1 Tax=Fusarium austroafricanum TaxID=2364996 RepID=A0A8H4KGJ2_9HYPO|nr:hypothetical protein F53441_7031 [Fusarium austroafricanum]